MLARDVLRFFSVNRRIRFGDILLIKQPNLGCELAVTVTEANQPE